MGENARVNDVREAEERRATGRFTCRRCGDEMEARRHKARGLCDRCWNWCARHDGFADFPVLLTRVDDPHVHNCPACADGGMVAADRCDDAGHVLSYVCLARAHETPYRFKREEAA